MLVVPDAPLDAEQGITEVRGDLAGDSGAVWVQASVLVLAWPIGVSTAAVPQAKTVTFIY